jgi:hypothetical protein
MGRECSYGPVNDDASISDVKVLLMVYNIIDVDITKHQFTIEFLLEVSWKVLLDAGHSDACILGHEARSMQHDTQHENLQRCHVSRVPGQ